MCATDNLGQNLGLLFKNWGYNMYESLSFIQKIKEKGISVVASGGIRNGIDVLKALYYGAHRVSIARPLLEAAVESEEKLDEVMRYYEQGLKIAMFGCGFETINQIHNGN